MMLTGPPILPAGKLTWVSAPGPRLKLRLLAPSLTWTLAVVVPGLRTWMLSPTMPAVARSNHIRWLTAGAWAELSAPTSLQEGKYGTRQPARTRSSATTFSRPPMLSAGKLPWVAAAGGRLKLTGVAAGRLTVPVAVAAPGLMTWMLSPTMPAVERSNQLR